MKSNADAAPNFCGDFRGQIRKHRPDLPPLPVRRRTAGENREMQMAYGDYEGDRNLLGEWERFCERLKDAGKLVFKDANPPTALHRADGFRYLTQNLSQAFDLALETKNTKFPQLLTFCSPRRKLGADNADCIYMQAWIDGESVYRLSGRKGSARMWNVTVQGPRTATAYGQPGNRILHEPFGDTPEANMFGDELVTDSAGNFELFIGGERRGPNWLPTTAGSRKLFLRQYFDSWDEEPAQLRIERVGMAEPAPLPTPDDMIEAMRWAGQFAHDVVEYWPEWSWSSRQYAIPDEPNRMRSPAQRAKIETDKRRGRVAAAMWWELREDEALVLEFADPGTFWMITCEAVFGNSMDYLYRPVSYTPSRTAIDPDGKIRLVLSGDDPGYWNWIDNQRFIEGELSFRNVQTLMMPEFETRVVRKSDVPRHMHPGARRATFDDRRREIERRFHANQRRFPA